MSLPESKRRKLSDNGFAPDSSKKPHLGICLALLDDLVERGAAQLSELVRNVFILEMKDSKSSVLLFQWEQPRSQASHGSRIRPS